MHLIMAYIILLIHMLDTSIVNVALLSMTTDLMREPLAGHWIITAFFVGLASAMPFAQKMVARLGEKPALTWALLLSVGAIGACGLSHTFLAVVASRFVQGLTSGVVALLLQKLILKYVGPDARAFGLSLWASAVSLAPVLGPVLGAATIGVMNWHWIFLGQVPILVAAAWCIRDEFSLRIAPAAGAPSFAGALLAFAGATLCLELGLDSVMKVNREPAIVALGWGAGAVVAAWLLRLQLARGSAALFDWSLLRERTYRSYACIGVTVGAVTVTTSVIYTIWLQVQLNLGLRDVANILAAGGLIAGGLTPLIGRIKNRRVLPLIVFAGLACLATSFFLCSRLTDSAAPLDLVAPRILAGFGTALCSPCAFLAVSTLDGPRILGANALSLFIRTVCGSVAIVLVSGLSERLQLLLSEQALAAGFGSNAGYAVAPGAVAHIEDTLAALCAHEAMHLIFLAAAAATCALAVLLASVALPAVATRWRQA